MGASLNIDERLDFLLDYKTNFLDGCCNAHSGSIILKSLINEQGGYYVVFLVLSEYSFIRSTNHL